METLDELLKKAEKYEMSPREIWNQRVSYAYDNLRLSNSSVTREMVEERATEMFGPRPEKRAKSP